MAEQIVLRPAATPSPPHQLPAAQNSAAQNPALLQAVGGPVVQPDQPAQQDDAQAEPRVQINVGDVFVDDAGNQMVLRPVDDVPTVATMQQVAADTIGPVEALVKQL